MKWFLCFILAALVGVGCNQQSSSPTANIGNVPATPQLPTEAQPKLQTIKLWMGSEEVTAELALTQDQQMTGMMFRTNIEELQSCRLPIARWRR